MATKTTRKVSKGFPTLRHAADAIWEAAQRKISATYRVAKIGSAGDGSATYFALIVRVDHNEPLTGGITSKGGAYVAESFKGTQTKWVLPELGGRELVFSGQWALMNGLTDAEKAFAKSKTADVPADSIVADESL